MPLSEDEQRILRQIEEQLQRDTGFGRTVQRRNGGSARALALWVVAAVACLVATVATLSIHPVVAFAAFVGAVVTALFAEQQLRRVGQAGLAHLTDSVRGRFGSPQGPGGRGAR